jgi:hypothetical protein
VGAETCVRGAGDAYWIGSVPQGPSLSASDRPPPPSPVEDVDIARAFDTAAMAGARSAFQGLPPCPAAVAERESVGMGEEDRRRLLLHWRLTRWVPNAESNRCPILGCNRPFVFPVRRRHHCRCCGRCVCGQHSHSRLPLPRYGYRNAVRVCDDCRPVEMMSTNASSKR